MSESKELTCRIENILEKVAGKKNFTNYKINFKLTEQTKDGFSSDMHLGSIVNKDSGEEHFLILKKQFDHDIGVFKNFSDRIYENEIYFYEEVIPTFKKFQKEKTVTDPFHEFPKYFLASLPPKAYLVLENLSVQGFKMFPKELAFPKEYLELIFKTYGKFHGISFAMRDQNPEDYEKLVRNCVNFIADSPEWGLGENLNKLYEEFKISQEHVAEKIEKYQNWGMKDWAALAYKGEHKCIVHGDCWSNNMMFKYSEDNINQVKDIRLIDFQMIREDTPVHDLAYFFYSGAAKEDFDNLDYYLKLYHDSFSDCLSELGSSATKLYPFKTFKSEWVEHCKYGFLAATMVLKLKFPNVEDLKKKFGGKSEVTPETFQTLKCDEEKYNKRMTDLILHLCDIGGL